MHLAAPYWTRRGVDGPKRNGVSIEGDVSNIGNTEAQTNNVQADHLDGMWGPCLSPQLHSIRMAMHIRQWNQLDEIAL